MNKIFALVDCNNFFASCERVFNPKLEGKPVIVLSNNDGCIIARSNEAKTLGLKMGAPYFEHQEIIKKNNIHVFSTNFTLYGDISQRVMMILSNFTPELEIYSIDEAFLDLSEMPGINLSDYSQKIKKTIKQWTGMPVSIGVAQTKTLAKIANHLAKKYPDYSGVLDLINLPEKVKALEKVKVENIWGIGRKHSKFLMKNNIKTALQLKNTDDQWVKKHMGVVSQRIVLELRGEVCYPLDLNPADKKEICTSRSYGHPLENYEEIEQATTTYITRTAEKLRKQHSFAQTLIVFLMTNRFSKDPQYANYKIIQLPVATNDTIELIHYTVKTLKSIFRKGYKYKKSGVIVTNLIPDNQRQIVLWDEKDREKSKELMNTIDKINKKLGRDKIGYAIQGTLRPWKMRQEKLSPCYTTKWEDILTINVKHQTSNF
jgi:DNA polymerase V